MSNPHFNVINSNSLETLAKICAQLMERYPLADPLLNEEIVVMNMGMRSFLTQEIAKQNQIAAQCNFQQIWQLIWNIHNKVNGSDDKLNRFDRSYIAWNIAGMRDIWSNPEIKGFEKMQEYVKDDPDGSRCYELAAKIADTFDQYQMYRPDWIAAFNTFTYEDFLAFDADNDAPGKINDWINENTRSKNSEGRGRAIREVLISNLWQVRLWCMLRSNFLLQNEDGTALADGQRIEEGACVRPHILDERGAALKGQDGMAVGNAGSGEADAATFTGTDDVHAIGQFGFDGGFTRLEDGQQMHGTAGGCW